MAHLSSFNSLFGIRVSFSNPSYHMVLSTPFSGFPVSSIEELASVVLSTPFSGFRTGLSTRRNTSPTFNSLFGIHELRLKGAYPWMVAFNSLFGIPVKSILGRLLPIISFQLPFRDSSTLVGSSSSFSSSFNSLFGIPRRYCSDIPY